MGRFGTCRGILKAFENRGIVWQTLPSQLGCAVDTKQTSMRCVPKCQLLIEQGRIPSKFIKRIGGVDKPGDYRNGVVCRIFPDAR